MLEVVRVQISGLKHMRHGVRLDLFIWVKPSRNTEIYSP